MRKLWTMGGAIRSMMFWAPPGEGTGDGTNGTSGGTGGTGESDNGFANQFGFGSGYNFAEPDDDSGDLDEVLEAFGTGSDAHIEPDDTTEPAAFTGFADATPEQVDALQNEIRTAINGMRVPADIIPEGFDPSDSGQMQQMLSKVMQLAVSQSLNVVFKPVQLAMGTMASQFDGRIQKQISSAMTNSGARDIIMDAIPEMRDDRYRGMLQSMDTTLKQAGKKPTERAKLMRKMLTTMGVKRGEPAAAGGGDSAPIGTRREGNAALDSFFKGMTMSTGRR